MRKLRVLLVALSLLLPLLVVNAALAQDGDDDDDGDGDRMHPVVKVLAHYFDEDEEDIEGYHDDGIGFGVLVKLYAMAAENDEDPEDLIEAYLDGTTLRELYDEYGKPALRGVGHVRRLPVDPDDGDDEPPAFLPPGRGGTPPGHGGMPPGQAKKWADPPGGGNHIVPLPIVPRDDD